MARRPDTPCSICGVLLFRGRGSLPPERMTCRSCRSSGVRRTKKTGISGNRRAWITCPCGAVVWKPATQVYCSRSCRSSLRPRPHPPVPIGDGERIRKARRRALERGAPGLSQQQRTALLARWKRQGRQCWMCDRPASTVDHLVPLSRGGTNYEGNLAPACKHHNSSRGSLFIVEWYHAKSRWTSMSHSVTITLSEQAG